MRSYGVWRRDGGYCVCRKHDDTQGTKSAVTFNTLIPDCEGVLFILSRLSYATVSNVWFVPDSPKWYATVWIGDNPPSITQSPQQLCANVTHAEALELFTAYLRMV